MATEIAVVKDRPKLRTWKHARLEFLERPPAADWFIPVKTTGGATKWFLRFAVTGMFPRLFGPFPSKRQALNFLDEALIAMGDFWTSVDDIRNKYANEGEFEHIAWGPIIEYSYPGMTQPLPTKGR